MLSTTFITLGFVAVGLGVLIFVFYKLGQKLDQLQNNKDASKDAIIIDLNRRVDELNKNVSDSLHGVTQTVLKQLNENTRRVDSRLQSSNQDWLKSAQQIRQTIDGNIRTLREVTNKLSQVEEANKRIFDIGKDISSLQEILRAPKVRGVLGELFLDGLLSQIFPKDRYKLQYTFKSGESVDAVLKLRDGRLVSIDAKFPLESFKRMLDTPDKDRKKIFKKEFVKSVKKRIDEISQKYIVPDEGTFDFALMYIPAENVYYETIIKSDDGSDLAAYSYSKRVIPVSPNNLYVYLQTIILGLRGMQIEERAKEILADLSRLNTDFSKVTNSYEVLGKHISSAANRYDETSRLLAKFGTKVEQIEEKTDPKPEPIASEPTTALPLENE